MVIGEWSERFPQIPPSVSSSSFSETSVADYSAHPCASPGGNSALEFERLSLTPQRDGRLRAPYQRM